MLSCFLLLEYAKVGIFCEMANITKKNARGRARGRETGLGGPGRKKGRSHGGERPYKEIER